MRCKVYSAPLARRRRRWAAACGRALIACAAAAWPAAITLTALHAADWARIVTWTPAAMTPFIVRLSLPLPYGPDVKGVRLRGEGRTHSVRNNDATVVTIETKRHPLPY